ncbi:hypothetical protein PSP6_300072 [Paraburkholderia tropica]|uniref:hypothetical protein n=1 Tax=Paraburkholderia tropica TaxID=92647 RepID=UPI001CAF346F|nr:hypothetical protein [Paraburkholderia tropica]CAG9212252.1 hypothetical protein PSP6_300072 [Paraburkholderia tropica]
MQLSSYRWIAALIVILSGCTSISGSSSLSSRPSVPASRLSVRYIQNTFRATNPRAPGISYSPAALLERDGYYDLGNEIRFIAPEVASARGLEADVDVSNADIRGNNPWNGVGPYASRGNSTELVLFVRGGQSTQNSADVLFVFHAIFRDVPRGIEYWHADYRVKVNTLTPWDPAFDSDTVRKLIIRVFDDLEKDGLIRGAQQKVTNESQPEPLLAPSQPIISEGEAAGSPEPVPYIDARGQEGYRKWLAGGAHGAFAISTDGHWGYSPGASEASENERAAEQRAISICQILATTACFIYARDSRVIWHGADRSPAASVNQ